MHAAAGLALAGRFRGAFSRKLKNAGVTDACLPRFRNRPCADLAEGRSIDETASAVQTEFSAQHPGWPRAGGLAALARAAYSEG